MNSLSRKGRIILCCLTLWGSHFAATGFQTQASLLTRAHNRLSFRSSQHRLLESPAVANSINGAVANGADRAYGNETLRAPAAFITKIGLMCFIMSMCVALPATLLPQWLLFRLGLLGRKRKERWAVQTSQYCARLLHRLIPFCRISVITDVADEPNPPPAVWACNHTSMLDVFILLIADQKLRGPNKRPIKIVYWKNLEENPVTKLLFRQAGFIPVAMAPNKPGEDNEYDKGSFRQLLKSCKQAFDEGFDIGILPEGQLNPSPEAGLMPVFSGAFTLARLSKRPINLMALNGIHRLWHPTQGMAVTGRHAKVRAYGQGRSYESSDEFKATFEKVVGEFGMKGIDLNESELTAWLSGEAWKRKKAA